MKKLLVTILSVLLVLSVIPTGIFSIPVSAATSGTTGDCTWTLDGTVLTISGNGEMESYPYSGSAPWGTSLTSVVIENGITSIGGSAFSSCQNLTSVTIPNSVTSIGIRAFVYCTSLASINIPDSVINIGYEAFDGCSSLTNINIPDSVTRIGDYAFFYTAYYNNSNNWQNNVLYIGNHLIKAKTSITGSYTIKEGTKTIAEKAFYNHTSLTSITIPNSVTSIGESAFGFCDNLTDVWYGGSESDKASISIGSNNTELTNATWYYKSCIGASEHTYAGGYDAICNVCGFTREVTDHSFLTYTVSNNEATITGVSPSISGDIFVPSTLGGYPVTGIGEGAFDFCTSLTSVIIPDGVTSIGERAFSSCTSLASVTIPNSVTSIGERAFSSCTSLTSVYITDIAAWCNISFGGDSANPLYYAKNLYLNGKLVTNLVIPNSVSSIGNYAFSNCTSLTSVTIPDSVTSIGNSAFYKCTSLTSVTIPDSVTSIGSSAFYYCDGLTSITIGNSVTSIGYCTFFCCDGLTSITIPDSVTSIGNGAFFWCTNIISVIFGNSVTSIGNSAFLNCESLTSVTIPDSVTSIDQEAFSGCNALKDIYYLGSKNQAENISIGAYNVDLINTTWHYNSCIGTAKHTYANTCDTTCNVCDNVREIRHTLKRSFDDNTHWIECSVCGEKQETPVEHVYDNTCDTTCNVCDNVREITHTYIDSFDKTCNVCEHTRELVNISVTTTPTKLFYLQGSENLNLSGGQITLLYDDETTGVTGITADMVTGFDSTELGEKTLTITYGGKTTTLTIYIVDVLPGDINGDAEVNVVDLALLKKMVAGLSEIIKTDLNGDGKTDVVDLAILKKIVAGLA